LHPAAVVTMRFDTKIAIAVRAVVRGRRR